MILKDLVEVQELFHEAHIGPSRGALSSSVEPCKEEEIQVVTPSPWPISASIGRCNSDICESVVFT
jgi:hypothetical protein